MSQAKQPSWMMTSTTMNPSDLQNDASIYFDPGMTDLSYAIADWADRKKFDSPKNFEDTTVILSKLMLAVTEIGEAAEAARKLDKDNFREEMADTIIRLLHLAAALGLDVASDVYMKMEYNETRPEKHGNPTGV